jgi:hypothetical protein
MYTDYTDVCWVYEYLEIETIANLLLQYENKLGLRGQQHTEVFSRGKVRYLTWWRMGVRKLKRCKGAAAQFLCPCV